MLAATALCVPRLLQSRSAESIPLEAVSNQVGTWTCTSEEVSLDTGGGVVPEGKRVTRRYEDNKGALLTVILTGTYTRLGAMKDFSVARVAQGWTDTGTHVAQLGTGDECRLQTLQREGATELAASVYCSPHEVVPDFRRAELIAARQRLVGRTEAWGQAYVVARVSEGISREQATEQVLQFLTGLVPELQNAIAGS